MWFKLFLGGSPLFQVVIKVISVCLFFFSRRFASARCTSFTWSLRRPMSHRDCVSTLYCVSQLSFYNKLKIKCSAQFQLTKIVSLEIIVHILRSTKGLRLLSPNLAVGSKETQVHGIVLFHVRHTVGAVFLERAISSFVWIAAFCAKRVFVGTERASSINSPLKPESVVSAYWLLHGNRNRLNRNQ